MRASGGWPPGTRPYWSHSWRSARRRWPGPHRWRSAPAPSAYGEARLLVSALVAVAGLIAAPLYLLRRDGQLYFGGTTGLVTDTFGSLLDRTAYGAVYAPNQVPIALVCLALVAMALVVALAAARAIGAPWPAPLMVLAIIALVAIALAAQHALLGTPWLTGRTALFLLPLISTFVVLTRRCTRPIRPARPSHRGRAHGAARVGFGLAHARAVANVGSTLDWPDDAATPAMLGEVAARVDRAAAANGPRRRPVDVLPVGALLRGADERRDARRTQIEVAPAEGPAPDFVYTAERLDPAAASLIGGFDGSPGDALADAPAGRAARECEPPARLADSH